MNNPQAEFQQAFALHQRGQLDAAEKIYKSILLSQPSISTRFSPSALFICNARTFARRNGQFSLAIKINPDNSPLHNNRGNALLGLNRLQDALASYDKRSLSTPGIGKLTTTAEYILAGIETI